MKEKLTKLLAATTIFSVILSINVLGFEPGGGLPEGRSFRALAGGPENSDILTGSTGEPGGRDMSGPFSNGADDELSIKTETASGLTTTSFDTLVGTVSVNIPDDLAAGDTISGTVFSEPKGKTAEEQAKNQAELIGFVVEVAKQSPPSKKEGGNLIDFCKTPAQALNSYSNGVCGKWSVPEGASKVPIVLKNTEGKTIGKTEIPVGPKANPAGAMVDFFTPAAGQAGKPISVKGPFDGDFANTVIKIGDQGTKFLASSPRKVVVESPRDLKGEAEIVVDHNGKTVAKCGYRNISVKLAADKLNLLKGEQANLTMTLAGLIGLLSPVSVQLSNKSPGTVSMSGGETQTVVVSPRDVNGDIFTAKRTLTGVQAGGFSISALVDAVNGDGPCTNPGVKSTAPAPGQNGTIPGPHTGDNHIPTDPPPPPRPTEARYRVTLNGFFVNNQTYEGFLRTDGWGDEVTVLSHVGMVDSTGRLTRIMWGSSPTGTMGETPPNAVRAGRGTAAGGLQTGDGFPTQTPWVQGSRTNAVIPPARLFEGNLRTDNSNAAFVIPTIWEWDGAHDQDLMGDYGFELNEASPAFAARIVSDIIRTPQPLVLGSFLRSGEWTRIANVLNHTYGLPQDRPIGMNLIGSSRYGFDAKALILTNASADFISTTDFGSGTGIVPVRYVDHSSLAGDYTMYLQVERVDTGPCAASITGARFTGTAELRTTRAEAPGPYNSDVNLTVDFTECRGLVRITNFPPLTSNSLTALGPNTSTMTMTSGGSGRFTPSSGRIDVPVTLGLQNSLLIFGNSTLPLTLSGTIDPATGTATFRGTGTFSGGQLGTYQGTVVVTGTFSPRP